MNEDDIPDCSDLLDEFIELSSSIAPGDTLILKISNNAASIELLMGGVSVFKQDKVMTKALAEPEGPAN